MKIKAFGKINLTLDVTGKREDGYHLLDTVMQSVSLWDEIEIFPAKEPGVRLWSNKKYLPTDTKNTAYRAATLFFEHTGLATAGVEISLKKVIPSRAGMGGGSTDAAAVLHGLDELFETKLGVSKLMELGAQVGADVPFCVHGGTCRCTGTGEKVEPVPPMPDCFLVLCKPPAGISTPRAYALLDQYPMTRTQATQKMVQALGTGDLRQIGKSLSNRFEETMKLMQVKAVEKIMLSAGALGAMMTGSGSAVYGIFEGESAAKSCMELLASHGDVFLARPCTGLGQDK